MNFGDYYIPKEIVGEIISHVKNPVDLARLTGVSHLFREFAKPKFRTKYKKIRTKSSKLAKDGIAACIENGIRYMLPFFLKIFTLTEKNRWILKYKPQFSKDILSIIPIFKISARTMPEVNQEFRQLAEKFESIM
uniref:F-box domain-containing protein n=1 Tax=Marseillevirus LCMAC102 TaxID=2506603 RepID=A0A481YVA6_9VIRU|nr:MAG: hypothetical protein LCMAC102_02790 [Marseillevirus LCMAC102]